MIIEINLFSEGWLFRPCMYIVLKQLKQLNQPRPTWHKFTKNVLVNLLISVPLILGHYIRLRFDLISVGWFFLLQCTYMLKQLNQPGSTWPKLT